MGGGWPKRCYKTCVPEVKLTLKLDKTTFYFSLIVNVPVFSNCFVLNFFNPEVNKDFAENHNLDSNENDFYFSFNDDVPDL